MVGTYLIPYSLAIKHSIGDEDVLGHRTEKLRTPLIITSAFLTFFNIYSFCLILKALLMIKKWIKNELDDLRRWKCKRDGLFVLYLLSFSVLAIIEIAFFFLLAFTPILDTLDYDQTYHGNLIFVFMGFIYQQTNFFATVFALFMFERMSKAIWSKKLKEEQNNKKTSQMDREVAAGWFDEMLLDREFKFRNFMRNVPQS